MLFWRTRGIEDLTSNEVPKFKFGYEHLWLQNQLSELYLELRLHTQVIKAFFSTYLVRRRFSAEESNCK